jgi:hypothetical protein
LNLLWSHQNGSVSLWTLSSIFALESGHEYGPFEGWGPVAVVRGGSGAKAALLWQHTNRFISLWDLSSAGVFQKGQEFSP